MHATFPQIARVLTDLALHPQYISQCISHHVINGKTLLDHQMPGFCYPATRFMENYLQPQMTVCEYGSGGSTLFFAKRAHFVWAIENDLRRYELLRQRLTCESVRNVKLDLRPLERCDRIPFAHSSYLHAIPDRRFDVVVIDDRFDSSEAMGLCFQKAEARIRLGGVIVLDSSQNHQAVRAQNHAHHFRVFEGISPVRPGIGTTDVYFY